jgi:hypothetical protein
MMKIINDNPWLGSVLHVEPFRPLKLFVTGAILLLIGPFLFLGTRITPEYWLLLEALFWPVPLILAGSLYRCRLVICEGGVLIGPSTITSTVDMIPYDMVFLMSLTAVQNFSRFRHMGIDWGENGSERWGKWGIVFRSRVGVVWLSKESFGKDNPDITGAKTKTFRQHCQDFLKWKKYVVYEDVGYDIPLSLTVFGTRHHPSEVITHILRAAADHGGCPWAFSVPAATETPVTLPRRQKKFRQALPRIFGDMTPPTIPLSGFQPTHEPPTENDQSSHNNNQLVQPWYLE